MSLRPTPEQAKETQFFNIKEEELKAIERLRAQAAERPLRKAEEEADRYKKQAHVWERLADYWKDVSESKSEADEEIVKELRAELAECMKEKENHA